MMIVKKIRKTGMRSAMEFFNTQFNSIPFICCRFVLEPSGMHNTILRSSLHDSNIRTRKYHETHGTIFQVLHRS